jgi:TP901 family phage tail tape measure protein
LFMAGKVYEIGFKIAGDLSGNFAKSFKTANDAVKNFSGNINKMNKEAADVASMVKLKQEIGENARAYTQAKQKVAELGRQISATKTPSKELVAEFNRQQAIMQKARSAIDRQRASLKQLESQNGLAGASLKQLIAREKELARNAERVAKAQDAQARASKAMGENTKTIKGTAHYAGLAAAAGGAGLMKAFSIGAAFESDMAKVAAVSRASDEQLKQLTETARQLGADTVWSASEAAQGMQYLAMAGFKVEDIVKTMPGMLNLASAGAIDLASASDIASNILTGFGLSASDMNRVGDVLTNTFTQSNTTLQGLGATMKYAAPVAKAMGVSIEEAAAMAGKLGDAGIQGEMAGTTLRSVLLRLSAPSEQAAEALKVLKVKTTDAKGQMKSFPQILKELNKAMSGMSESARANFTKTIFETEAMSGALVLMEQAGTGALDGFIDSVQKVGSSEQVAGKQIDNLKGDMTILNSALQETALKIYDSVAPALRLMAQGAIEVVQDIGAWAKENPGLLKGIVSIVGGVAALAAACIPMGLAMKSALFIFSLIKAPILAVRSAIMAVRMGWLLYKGAVVAGTVVTKGARAAQIAFSAAAKVMAAAQWALNAAMSANPIGLVIVAIAALIAIGVLLYRNWDTIREKVLALWGSFSEKFPAIAEIVRNYIGQVIEIWEKVKKTFSSIIDFVKNVFAGEWGAAWESIKDAFGNAFGALVGLVKLPFNTIISMVNGVTSSINNALAKVKVPDWVPVLGGKSIDFRIPKIPQLAEGGIATRSTLANIGEGSEPEAVLPLSKLSSMLGGASGGGSISVSFSPTINVTGGSGDVYAEVRRGLDAGRTDLERSLEKLMANNRRISFA